MRSAKEREKVGALSATIVTGMAILDVTALANSTLKEEVKEERRELKMDTKEETLREKGTILTGPHRPALTRPRISPEPKITEAKRV